MGKPSSSLQKRLNALPGRGRLGKNLAVEGAGQPKTVGVRLALHTKS